MPNILVFIFMVQRYGLFPYNSTQVKLPKLKKCLFSYTN